MDKTPSTHASVERPESRSSEEARERRSELAQVTLESIGDGVIRTDAMGRVRYMNPMAEKLTGWTLPEAEGRDISEVFLVVSETTRRPRVDPVQICLAEKATQTPPGLFVLRSRDGNEATIRDTASPLLGENQEVLGAVVVFRDLTHVRSLERQMAYLTSHDPLTGLLNRQDFEIYLEAALESARDRDDPHALLHLGLVELKLVNDCFGHVAGDELLRQVASLMQEVAGDGAVLARVMGGDFTVLLDGKSSAAAVDIARKLQKRIGEFRFVWAGQPLEVGFHIGIVEITAKSSSITELLRAADTACHLARLTGRGRIHVFDRTTDGHDDHRGRLHWVQRIRQALTEDRFVLYAQRICALRGQQDLYEVLVRLRGEDGQPILPSEFIPVAEAHNMAPLIDRWVVRRCFDQLAANSQLFAGAPVTLNLSGQTLGDEVFLRDLVNHLDEHADQLDPSRIYFEITETHAVANLGRALRFIGQLKDLGCRFVLDDFGSGFASFAYLKSLPVDLVKIDGQFVRDMARDPVARAMVSSINEIAHLMGLETIAEWVEDDITLDLVRQIGVDFVQGFGLHRPEPTVDIK